MTRKRTIAVVSFFLAILMCLSAFVLVKYYERISETGLRNAIPYGFGKKARVILLAGQSNAAGCSRDEYLQKNVSEEQYARYKKGFDNVYINYFASGTNASNGFVKSSVRQGEGLENGFFGPELGLAERLSELYPDETIFIIKWAWGGTDLHEQWRAPGEDGSEGGHLYHGFLEYVMTSLEFLQIKNYDIEIEAMCWMQGESDSIEEQDALAYEENLQRFVTKIREDLSEYASDDGIAFVDAYIAATIFWKHYQEINRAKQAVADSSPMNAVVDTIAHGLTVTEEPIETPDIAHYDSLSEIKLGHLFADEVARFFD